MARTREGFIGSVEPDNKMYAGLVLRLRGLEDSLGDRLDSKHDLDSIAASGIAPRQQNTQVILSLFMVIGFPCDDEGICSSTTTFQQYC